MNFLLDESNELSNEEMHVIGNKANYDWLMESKEQLEKGNFSVRNLAEVSVDE